MNLPYSTYPTKKQSACIICGTAITLTTYYYFELKTNGCYTYINVYTTHIYKGQRRRKSNSHQFAGKIYFHHCMHLPKSRLSPHSSTKPIYTHMTIYGQHIYVYKYILGVEVIII